MPVFVNRFLRRRAADLVFQKPFNGAAWKKERFGKDSDKEILPGYYIAAFYRVSKNGYIKCAARGIAGKSAALAFYSRLGFAQYLRGRTGKWK